MPPEKMQQQQAAKQKNRGELLETICYMHKQAHMNVMQRTEAAFNDVVSREIGKFHDNEILRAAFEPNGLPKSVFLKRLTLVRPASGVGRENECPKEHLRRLFGQLSGDPGHGGGSQAMPVDRSTVMENIRRILRVKKWKADAMAWICANEHGVIEGMTCAFESAKKCLIEETCYTAAYLSLTLRDQMGFGMAKSLMRSLICLIAHRVHETDHYLKDYRLSRSRHADQELVRGVREEFRIRKLEYTSLVKVQHSVVACAYYAITYLLHYCRSAALLIYFVKRIVKRCEMTRYYLLRLLQACSSANLQPDLFISADQSSVEDYTWTNLPMDIFFLLLPLTVDKNSLNRRLIYAIIERMRILSPIRLPEPDSGMLQTVGPKMKEQLTPVEHSQTDLTETTTTPATTPPVLIQSPTSKSSTPGRTDSAMGSPAATSVHSESSESIEMSGRLKGKPSGPLLTLFQAVKIRRSTFLPFLNCADKVNLRPKVRPELTPAATPPSILWSSQRGKSKSEQRVD